MFDKATFRDERTRRKLKKTLTRLSQALGECKEEISSNGLRAEGANALIASVSELPRTPLPPPSPLVSCFGLGFHPSESQFLSEETRP